MMLYDLEITHVFIFFKLHDLINVYWFCDFLTQRNILLEKVNN